MRAKWKTCQRGDLGCKRTPEHSDAAPSKILMQRPLDPGTRNLGIRNLGIRNRSLSYLTRSQQNSPRPRVRANLRLSSWLTLRLLPGGDLWSDFNFAGSLLLCYSSPALLRRHNQARQRKPPLTLRLGSL